MLKEKTKYMVVLDWDGTVTRLPFDQYGTWGSMDLHLLDGHGVVFTQELREHMLGFIRRNQFDRHGHLLWFELSIAAWIKRGLNRDHIQDVFGDCNGNLRPGFVDFLRWLKQKRSDVEIFVVINSYGIVEFIKATLEGIGASPFVDHIAATPLNFDDEGNALGCDRDKILLPENKWKETENMAAQLKATMQNTIGIGDSSGDRHIAWNRLLLAFDQEQVDRCGEFFDAHVISEDWSGPRAWLEKTYGF